MHPACSPAEDLLKECDMRTGRRGGPGGQHRNKVETAVILTHRPSGISAEANERRSQADNRRVALFRLRLNLACQWRSQPPNNSPALQPTELWQSRSRNGRIAVSESHHDFPAIMAEVLDRLALDEFELSTTAEFFGVSTSQLVKLLRACPEALAQVNLEREKLGLRKLR